MLDDFSVGLSLIKCKLAVIITSQSVYHSASSKLIEQRCVVGDKANNEIFCG